MLDQSFCDGLSLQGNVQLDLNSLRELRGIVDLQLGASLDNNMGSHPRAVKGQRHGKEPSADSTAGVLRFRRVPEYGMSDCP